MLAVYQTPGFKMNAHRMEWKAKKAVMETIIGMNGTIFGGAVRDWYIHDYYATKYYEAHAANEAHAEIEAHAETEAHAADAAQDYDNPSVMPELKDRMVIPNDIDAVLPESKLIALIKSLRKQGFYLSTQFHRDAKRYLPHLRVAEGDVAHRRIKIHYFQKECVFHQLRQAFPAAVSQEPAFENLLRATAQRAEEMMGTESYSFILDLMMPKEGLLLDAPFGGLDFECNGLLLDKNGMRLSSSLSGVFYYGPLGYDQYYNKILRDIRDRRAAFPIGGEVSVYRVGKMIERGWVITNFHTVEYKKDPAYDGYCIICHDELQENHYKMRCCDARFHTRCLLEALKQGHQASLTTTGKCLMCKHLRSARLFEEDARILEAIVEAVSPKLPPLTLGLLMTPSVHIEPALVESESESESESEPLAPPPPPRRRHRQPQTPMEMENDEEIVWPGPPEVQLA
jgi:hypothetical protein